MTVSYTWTFKPKTTEDGVIKECPWRCDGADGDLRASVYGLMAFAEAGADFKPYEDLTEADLIAWVNAVESLPDHPADIEAAVAVKIEAQRAPALIERTPPWAD